MNYEKQIKKSGFIDLINESVNTVDDIDIGDIEAVNKNFIGIKKRICKHTLLLYSPKQSRGLGRECAMAQNKRR